MQKPHEVDFLEDVNLYMVTPQQGLTYILNGKDRIHIPGWDFPKGFLVPSLGVETIGVEVSEQVTPPRLVSLINNGKTLSHEEWRNALKEKKRAAFDFSKEKVNNRRPILDLQAYVDYKEFRKEYIPIKPVVETRVEPLLCQQPARVGRVSSDCPFLHTYLKHQKIVWVYERLDAWLWLVKTALDRLEVNRYNGHSGYWDKIDQPEWRTTSRNPTIQEHNDIVKLKIGNQVVFDDRRLEKLIVNRSGAVILGNYAELHEMFLKDKEFVNSRIERAFKLVNNTFRPTSLEVSHILQKTSEILSHLERISPKKNSEVCLQATTRCVYELLDYLDKIVKKEDLENLRSKLLREDGGRI